MFNNRYKQIIKEKDTEIDALRSLVSDYRSQVSNLEYDLMEERLKNSENNIFIVIIEIGNHIDFMFNLYAKNEKMACRIAKTNFLKNNKDIKECLITRVYVEDVIEREV
jgi:hypothetical protein